MQATTGELKNQLQESISKMEQELSTIQPKITEVLEQNLRNEMHAVTYELRKQHKESITELEQEMRNNYAINTQKLNELIDEAVSNQVDSNEEVLNNRFDTIAIQLSSQQRLLDKLAKFLGI